MCLCGLTRGKGGEWTAADASPGSSMAAAARASGREQAVRGRGAPSGGERGRIAQREWCGRGGFREQYASRGSSREACGGHRRRSAAGQARGSGKWSVCLDGAVVWGSKPGGRRRPKRRGPRVALLLVYKPGGKNLCGRGQTWSVGFKHGIYKTWSSIQPGVLRISCCGSEISRGQLAEGTAATSPTAR